MKTDVDQFLFWEASTRDTIDFKKVYVDIAGDVLAGLVLSEIVFWHLPNKNGKTKLQVRHNGISWIAVRRYEWWDRTRLTPRQADRALGILEQAGIITKDIFKFDGMPTTHVALVWERFLPVLNDRLLNPAVNPNLPIGENVLTADITDDIGYHQSVITKSPIGDNDITYRGIPVTETTTETTTEIKEKSAVGVLSITAPQDPEAPFSIHSEDEAEGEETSIQMPENPEERRRQAEAIFQGLVDKFDGSTKAQELERPYTDEEIADQLRRLHLKYDAKYAQGRKGQKDQ